MKKPIQHNSFITGLLVYAEWNEGKKNALNAFTRMVTWDTFKMSEVRQEYVKRTMKG